MNKRILILAAPLFLAACGEKPQEPPKSTASTPSQAQQEQPKNAPQVRFKATPLPDPNDSKNPPKF